MQDFIGNKAELGVGLLRTAVDMGNIEMSEPQACVKTGIPMRPRWKKSLAYPLAN